MKRKVSNSELARASRKSNWNKMRTKGAIVALNDVAKDLFLDYPNYAAMVKAIAKLEQLMHNQIAADYEVVRAALLAERENDKAIDDLQF